VQIPHYPYHDPLRGTKMKTLVVYYSFDGNCGLIAGEIGKILGAA
jgi:hypothetical protein